MCTELFLAFFYFIIILFVNIFLLFLIRNSLSSINLYKKFKNIQIKFDFSKLNWILFVYIYNKITVKTSFNFQFENILNDFSFNIIKELERKDSILISKIYKKLKETTKANKYYFYLLEHQYLNFIKE